MLRLQPSEIAIIPDDIRSVNGRLGLRKRVQGKVKLHPGPERSRDEAVTSLEEVSYCPYTAAYSSEDDAGASKSPSSKARARVGLAPTSTSSSSTPLRSGHHITGIRSALALDFESPRSTSFALPHRAASNVQTVQPQLDGQLDAPSYRLQPMQGPWARNSSATPQLLQSRILSAPAFSPAAPHPPIHHVHSRQPLSESAIVLANGESNHTSSFADTGTNDNRAPIANNRYMNPHFAMHANVGEMSVCARTAITSTNHSNSSCDDAASSWRSSSSSSSAAEAAAADRPSPLDSITQQAALVHTRLVSQTRQNPVRMSSPATVHSPRNRRRDPFERRPAHISTEFPSYSRFYRDQSAQYQQPSSSAASILPSSSRGPSTTSSDTALPASHQSLLQQSSFTHTTLPYRLRDEPMQHLDLSSRTRHPTAGMIVRQPIPLRHSSRRILKWPFLKCAAKNQGIGLHTPMSSETATMVLPRTRPTSSISPSQAHGHAETQMPSPHVTCGIPSC
jgi:hypothetical protein